MASVNPSPSAPYHLSPSEDPSSNDPSTGDNVVHQESAPNNRLGMERGYSLSPMYSLILEYNQEQGSNLSTAAEVSWILQQPNLKLKDIVMENNIKDSDAAIRLADALLERITRTVIEFQTFLDRMAVDSGMYDHLPDRPSGNHGHRVARVPEQISVGSRLWDTPQMATRGPADCRQVRSAIPASRSSLIAYFDRPRTTRRIRHDQRHRQAYEICTSEVPSSPRTTDYLSPRRSHSRLLVEHDLPDSTPAYGSKSFAGLSAPKNGGCLGKEESGMGRHSSLGRQIVQYGARKKFVNGFSVWRRPFFRLSNSLSY